VEEIIECWGIGYTHSDEVRSGGGGGGGKRRRRRAMRRRMFKED